MDAVLYASAPKHQGRGRPRVKGEPVAKPKDRRSPWQTLKVCIYGKEVTVQVRVFDALWYRVAHSRKLRFVVVRGWPGHRKDDVLVCTDLELDAGSVVELYCQRWSLEETFGHVKSKLGFEDPHNRREHAVQRTAPMALWVYSLTIVWYAQWACRKSHLRMRVAPWYQNKSNPSFSDMLATLRRASWRLLILDPARKHRFDEKAFEPLLDAVAYG